MSKRSQWVEFDKETRKYIKHRDNEECVICHKKGGLQIMHIFLSRAKSGKGCKENGCLGCVKCHMIIDNPTGKTQNELSIKYLEYCKNYLKNKENIKDEKKLINSILKFDKNKVVLNSKINFNTNYKYQKRCINCAYFIQIKKYNNSIPVHYCTLLHQKIRKNNLICKNFKEE